MTQPASSAAAGGQSLPVLVDVLAAELVAQFTAAEQQLISDLARVARDTTTGYGAQVLMLGRMRQAAERVATQLRAGVLPEAERIVRIATANGQASAVAELARLARTAPGLGYLLAGSPTGHGLASANAIALDLADRLTAAANRITRFADDAYRAAITDAATTLVRGDQGSTPALAQRQAWQALTSKGVTGYTDTAGRRWNLASYVEMATRTTTQRAYNTAHQDRMASVGIRYFTISHDGHPCPLCRPFEGAILSTSGTGPVREKAANRDATVTFTVHATLDQARAEGLFHPNAILGNQAVSVLGEVENGVRANYAGPSVHLTTARGHHLTVSPNHPVLTSTGWLPAKALAKGMHVFSTGAGHVAQSTAVANVNLNHPQSTFEDELDALAARGGRTTVAAAADDLHGDGRFCQGEVEVVVADRRLLAVLDRQRVEVFCEHGFPRADVQAETGPGAGAPLLDSLAVADAVARSLPNVDAAFLEPPTDRRAADAETVPEILGGLAAGVEPDELVDVKWDWFEGHAFDLQTSTGAYLAQSILVHNCRHTLLPYLPGVTKVTGPPSWTAADQARYDATQRLRYLERQVRAAKRAQLGALDDVQRRRAVRRVRDLQAQIRAHVAANDLVRRPRREQLDLGNR